MNWSFVVLPLTGALIGFFTNWLAITFLFKPRNKVLGFQGVIPRNKEKIAEKVAEVSLEFLPSKIEKLSKVPFIGRKILGYISNEVGRKVKEMDDAKLERIVRKVAKRELFYIEISGAVLGGVIGLLQAVLLLFL